MSYSYEERFRRLGYFVDPSSIIDQGARIGNGTRIWHWCHVCEGARIGENCVIGQGCYVGPGVVIGDNVKIQNNVSVYRGVTLEDDVFVGPSVVFTNVLTPRAFVCRKSEYETTLVRRGATIGANATILCGNVLGVYAVVGAGAVVTRNVPGYALVCGVPAKICGTVAKDGTCHRS